MPSLTQKEPAQSSTHYAGKYPTLFDDIYAALYATDTGDEEPQGRRSERPSVVF